MRELERRMDALKNMSAPAIIPPSKELAEDELNDPKWSAFASAFFDHYSDLPSRIRLRTKTQVGQESNRSAR